jgi:hypothetical protein
MTAHSPLTRLIRRCGLHPATDKVSLASPCPTTWLIRCTAHPASDFKGSRARLPDRSEIDHAAPYNAPSSPKPEITQIACESTEEVDSVAYVGNRGFAGLSVGVDLALKLGRDGLLLRSGLQADRGES